VGEVAPHRAFSRIALATGVMLLLAGIPLAYYYTPIGWLFVLVGVLRLVNALNDLLRKDDLKRKLELLDTEFGRG